MIGLSWLQARLGRSRRFTTLFRGRSALLAVALIGAVFAGGCNNDLEDKNKMLNDDVTSLTAQNKDLQQQLDAANSNVRELQQQLATRPSGGAGEGGPASGGTTHRRGTGGGGGEAPVAERIAVAGDVLFSPGSDVITAAGKAELRKIATHIKTAYGTNHIRVEGYTDSDPIKKSKWPSNEALSAARAAAVEKYLATRGLSSSRMESVGMGAAKPKATKAQSRRVEIVVLTR